MIEAHSKDYIFETTWDVCVIGSGAMGLALARALGSTGKKVLILEAGSEVITDESQDFYVCQTPGRANEGYMNGRFRVFGGSTERWGGQAMQFEPVDLKARPGIYPEGWPVGLDEIAAYYDEGERLMGVPSPQYASFQQELEITAHQFGVDPQRFREATKSFYLHSSVFTAQPRLREVFRGEIDQSPDLVVLQNSPVVRLVMKEESVAGVEVMPAGGPPRTIAVRACVLACGCIENARFLLIQRDIFHLEALKRLPALGRYLQDHPGAHLGELEFTRGAFLQNSFRLKKRGGMSYKGRISWSGEKREAEGLMAVSGTLLMMRNRSEFDDAPQQKSSPMPWWEVLKALARGRVVSPLHHTYLAVSAEDLRDENSSISLSSSEKDALGFPRAMVDWRVSIRVAESIIRYMDEFEKMMTGCDLGRLRRFQFTAQAETLRQRLVDNYHPLGATSMGRDAETGVVDRDCRVFGIPNFYISGTSVLPTGSHANPTLTALALAFRLGHRLAGE